MPMKAMILAAGLGTRLLPLTETTPKPLFPVAGEPVLGRMIRASARAGCDGVVVNLHHLHEKIEAYLAGNDFGIRVRAVYEPVLLDTGGGIKNVRDFFGSDPFLVVNADIVTDIDLKAVADFHRSHGGAATLVLHDYPKFNSVVVEGGRITGFKRKPVPPDEKLLAFTGIQVVSPAIFDFIPDGVPYSSITAYEAMIEAGLDVRAMTLDRPFWHDMGSFEGYERAALETGAVAAFEKRGISAGGRDLSVTALCGDGSDRRWFRVEAHGKSLVAAAHGLRQGPSVNEADAFFSIGTHLKKTGAPVPEIAFYEPFTGHVYVEDLGDLNLMEAAREGGAREALYRKVVENLAKMAVRGAEGFNTAWTFQTKRYDEDLVMDREAGYFLDAFVNGLRGMGVDPSDFLPELRPLAEEATLGAPSFFLHRDMQSRNIMVKNGEPFFIDFQSGRLGPAQYDLASLLIDPYANLAPGFQASLLDSYLGHFSRLTRVDPEDFLHRYGLCAFFRNLQALGAFAFLSQVKKKPGFSEHIPLALESLKKRKSVLSRTPRFAALVASL